MATDATTRKVFHIFWAWQDEKEETWLREMAREGWHLKRVGLFRYSFEGGKPADVVYRVDYHNLRRRDRAEYLGIFRSAGWEHVSEVSNWHFFRTEAAAGADPQIFSDIESRVAMHKRVLAILIVFLPILNIGVMNLMRGPHGGRSAWLENVFVVGTVLYVLIMLLWAYAIVRIAVRIRQLQRAQKT